MNDVIKLYTRAEAAAAVTEATKKVTDAATVMGLVCVTFNNEVADIVRRTPELTTDERAQLAALQQAMTATIKAMAASFSGGTSH